MIHDTARGLYYFGRRTDRAFARANLLTLARLAPRPAVLGCLAATWLPEALVSRLGRVARRSR